MHLVYIPKFCITIDSNFSWVMQSPYRRNRRQCLFKIFGYKQGALWSMWKWWMTFTIFHSLSGYSGVGGRNLRFCTRKKTRNGRNEETVHNFPTSRSRKGGKRYFLRNPIFFFRKIVVPHSVVPFSFALICRNGQFWSSPFWCTFYG